MSESPIFDPGRDRVNGCMTEVDPPSGASQSLSRFPGGRPRSGASPRRERVGPGYDRHVRYPIVLFDLDGTLIDSGPIILASMRHASRAVLGVEIDEDRVRAAIGGPGLVAQMRELDSDRVDELVAAYRAHNEPLHDELEAFAGVLDVLPRLRERGHRLGIVTAKRRVTAELAFDRFPLLREQIEVFVGADDTELHKPDPDPLLEALDRLGARPGRAAYVGDSPFDVRAARAGGLFAVAVGWGGIHGDDALLSAEPDVLVHEPEELLRVL
jgi:pyrophosphatase PpaX